MSAREPFKQRLQKTLAREEIPVALRRGLGSLRGRRDRLFAPGEFDQVQQQLGGMKAAALDRLPELVAQFTREAEKAGAQVHLAKTVEDAHRIIGGIVRQNQGRLVVKSNSMATEEFLLN